MSRCNAKSTRFALFLLAITGVVLTLAAPATYRYIMRHHFPEHFNFSYYENDPERDLVIMRIFPPGTARHHLRSVMTASDATKIEFEFQGRPDADLYAYVPSTYPNRPALYLFIFDKDDRLLRTAKDIKESRVLK